MRVSQTHGRREAPLHNADRGVMIQVEEKCPHLPHWGAYCSDTRVQASEQLPAIYKLP